MGADATQPTARLPPVCVEGQPGDGFVTLIGPHPGWNPVTSFSRDTYEVPISINSTIGAS